jgi:hypothetical protein
MLAWRNWVRAMEAYLRLHPQYVPDILAEFQTLLDRLPHRKGSEDREETEGDSSQG